MGLGRDVLVEEKEGGRCTSDYRNSPIPLQSPPILRLQSLCQFWKQGLGSSVFMKGGTR